MTEKHEKISMLPTIAEHSKHAKFPASHTKKHQTHNQKNDLLSRKKNNILPLSPKKTFKHFFKLNIFVMLTSAYSRILRIVPRLLASPENHSRGHLRIYIFVFQVVLEKCKIKFIYEQMENCNATFLHKILFCEIILIKKFSQKTQKLNLST